MSTTTDDKILRTTKFPIEFNQKVDIQKVNADLMEKYGLTPLQPVYHSLTRFGTFRWIAGRIQEILGSPGKEVKDHTTEKKIAMKLTT